VEARLHKRLTAHRKIRVVSGGLVSAAVGPYLGDPATLIGDGRFSCAEVAQWVIDRIGCTSIVLSAWSVGLSECAWLGTLAQSADVAVVVDRSWPTRHAEFCRALVASIGADRVRVSRCHAKMLSIAGPGGFCAIRSSANFNPNPRIEQWDLDADQSLHDVIRDTLLSASLPLGASTPQVDAQFAGVFGGQQGMELDPFDLSSTVRFE
jgi:hypothetical protein